MFRIPFAAFDPACLARAAAINSADLQVRRDPPQKPAEKNASSACSREYDPKASARKKRADYQKEYRKRRKENGDKPLRNRPDDE